MTRRVTKSLLASLCMFFLLSGCSSSKDDPSDPPPKPGSNTTLPKNAGGDPSVSADDGGPGFTGEGWQTVEPYNLGDEKATKGGTFTAHIREWPGNLRMAGTGHNTSLNYLLNDLCYQSLLTLDPNTLEYIPVLASHWKISEDKKTFTYRIDPRARWSDGMPVTAEDVVATFKLHLDETLQDPSAALTFGKLETPIAKSKYIVEVTAKTENWRNFLYFSASLPIMPAHQIGDITGADYLDKFNYQFTAVSGPYHIQNYEKDIDKGNHIIITRRKDFWAADDQWNQGIYNFDKIRWLIVGDPETAFKKAVRGDIDYFVILKAEWWAKDLPEKDTVKNGWLVRQKVFNDAPNGVSGFAINMRKGPLQDVRVRKALQHLYARKTLIEKLAYNEYVPMNSHYAGSEYSYPGNEDIVFDPEKAVKLLQDAGWTEVGADGIRLQDGNRLSIGLKWYSPLTEKYLTSFKEACAKVGVEIRLERTEHEALWKILMERKFEMCTINWGGLVFPNPETSLNSTLADKNDNNNITGFKNERCDEIFKLYDVAFEQGERRKLIQEVDSIVTAQHPYVLSWYQPCQRIMYWNKFGVPEFGLRRTVDYDDAYVTWWYDTDKDKALKAARESDSKLELPPLEIHYWEEKQAKND